VILLAPLLFMTIEFGRVNLQAAGGGQVPKEELALSSWQNWTYYAERLPGQVGWPIIAACALVVVEVLARRRALLPLQARVFLWLWFLTGYVFFSAMALKEPRHTTLVLFPVAVAVVAGILRIVRPRYSVVIIPLLAVCSFAHTIAATEVPFVRGYESVVQYVERYVPDNSVILFSGYRDGNFIFNLRSSGRAKGLIVLRSDKLLLRMAVKREMGVEELPFTAEEITALLNRYHVRYVVSQVNFWTDLAPMRNLQRALHTASFRKVASYPLTSNVPHADQEIEIYENVAVAEDGCPWEDVSLTMDLRIIGSSIEARLPAAKGGTASGCSKVSGRVQKRAVRP
jgi:hypothetical protein